jgi:hypothetical protein
MGARGRRDAVVTLPPGRQSVIRENIKNAILGLPDWPSDVAVEKVGLPADVFQMGRRTMVGVCITDDSWLSVDTPIGDYVDQAAEMNVQIIVYATSESGGETSSVFEPDDGRIDTLVGLILGSNSGGYGPGLRSADIGVPGETAAVRLRAVKTQLIAEQKRAEGSGGALAKIIMMRTTTLPL